LLKVWAECPMSWLLNAERDHGSTPPMAGSFWTFLAALAWLARVGIFTLGDVACYVAQVVHASLGHSHPKVVKAAQEQIAKVVHAQV
jgi:hypothetical protein